MVTKRVKQNRYKPESAKTAADGKQKASGSRKGLSFFRIIVPVFVVAAMSLAAIWAHDAVVQSPFFTIQNIHIEGLNRVTRDELITRAGLDQPANLFEIHLAAVERQLVSHPWVARATVRRDLFTGLDIRIEEQEPLAIVTIENLADIQKTSVHFRSICDRTNQIFQFCLFQLSRSPRKSNATWEDWF